MRVRMGGEVMILGGVALLLLLIGGDAVTRRLAPPAEATGHSDGGEHRAEHGGVIRAIGDRHAEAVAERGGRVRLYVLDRDPSMLYPIPAPALSGEAQEDAGEATALKLRAVAMDGDLPGSASCFVGELPPALRQRKVLLTVTIPMGRRGYRARFTLGDAAHGVGGSEMPAAVPADRESQLFLTPGGRYTAADIAANGRVTASEKFRDFVPVHEMNPKPGARICPITATGASAACSWVIRGETYQFCCPPCVQEFVKRAKEQPEKIAPAASYIKR